MPTWTGKTNEKYTGVQISNLDCFKYFSNVYVFIWLGLDSLVLANIVYNLHFIISPLKKMASRISLRSILLLLFLVSATKSSSPPFISLSVARFLCLSLSLPLLAIVYYYYFFLHLYFNSCGVLLLAFFFRCLN